MKIGVRAAGPEDRRFADPEKPVLHAPCLPEPFVVITFDAT
jgi:hypothetical protein